MGAGGAHPPPHQGFLRAGWVPGSRFGTNNGNPSDGSPGPRGSSEQPLRSRSRRPRLRQGNTCARRSSRPWRRGAASSCCLATGHNPPPNPRGGGFSGACRCTEMCRAPCTVPGASVPPTAVPCPCSAPTWWVQPSLAVTRCAGCWQPPVCSHMLSVGLAAAAGGGF